MTLSLSYTNFEPTADLCKFLENIGSPSLQEWEQGKVRLQYSTKPTDLIGFKWKA